jgi:hypothetical protein
MRFIKSDSGYALVLTLLFMPVFVAMSLLVIDISRGNNAHSDLQAAADALALAGARELDGGVDSIDRAIAAMSNISNTVSFLGRTDEAAATALTFEVGGLDNPFEVTFLSSLPASDDLPIDFSQCVTNAASSATCSVDQGDARFVHVRAQSRDLSPFFGLFFESVTQVTDVPVAAQAVATFRSAACDVTPLFICNPFEVPAGQTPEIADLQVAFSQGRLHGRLIRLLPRGNGTAFPGNFGLLSSAEGNGVNTLREIFATGGNRTCYDSGLVTTQPGRPAAIRTGINVRFDMYDGNMNSGRNNQAYAPAANVRRGFIVDQSGGGGGNPNWCQAEPTPNSTWTTRFPDNVVMPLVPSSGARIGEGDWDLAGYWATNHPPDVTYPAAIPNSFPGALSPGASIPSRYDVYRYEIDNARTADLSRGDGTRAGTRESGLPQCTQPSTILDPTPEGDRRIIFAAIIDCLAEQASGRTELRVNSFASIFLVSPMLQRVPQPGETNVDPVEDAGVIDVEIVDISGAGGRGTLDTFVRNEANLVR